MRFVPHRILPRLIWLTDHTALQETGEKLFDRTAYLCEKPCKFYGVFHPSYYAKYYPIPGTTEDTEEASTGPGTPRLPFVDVSRIARLNARLTSVRVK